MRVEKGYSLGRVGPTAPPQKRNRSEKGSEVGAFEAMRMTIGVLVGIVYGNNHFILDAITRDNATVA
jgi:hypothetical protein